MQIKFKDIIYSNTNKIGFCIASGPSLKPYIKNLQNISRTKRYKFCLFSVNDIDKWYNFKCDYRVFANNIQTIKNSFLDLIKFKKTTIVFADTVDLTPIWLYKLLLYRVNFFVYDQRHFLGKNCVPYSDCCNRIQKNRLTIQEELQKFCNYNLRYGTGHTVAVHMLSLSILSGCKEIYLFGVDLNYKLGYANDNITNNDSFDEWIDEIIYDFNIIYQSALNIGVKIYSCSKDSPINKIIPFKEFNKNC
jgi:hypothetical protein